MAVGRSEKLKSKHARIVRRASGKKNAYTSLPVRVTLKYFGRPAE